MEVPPPTVLGQGETSCVLSATNISSQSDMETTWPSSPVTDISSSAPASPVSDFSSAPASPADSENDIVLHLKAANSSLMDELTELRSQNKVLLDTLSGMGRELTAIRIQLANATAAAAAAVPTPNATEGGKKEIKKKKKKAIKAQQEDAPANASAPQGRGTAARGSSVARANSAARRNSAKGNSTSDETATAGTARGTAAIVVATQGSTSAAIQRTERKPAGGKDAAAVPITAASTSTEQVKDNQDDMDTTGFQVVGSRKRPRRMSDSSADEAPSQPAAQQPRKQKVPPLILHGQESFATAELALSTAGITIAKSKTTRTGVAIHLASPDDHRLASKTLEGIGTEYHTYMLEEAKPLKVVIRGVPTAANMESWVDRKLKAMGYDVTSVVRMRSSRTRRPMPMVLATMPKTAENKEIFNITEISHMAVRIEAQYAKTAVSQCHRCQRFGHSQSNCHAIPRCVKCALQHQTSICQKPRTTPAKCCNCSGDHPANYQGCPAHPKIPSTPAGYPKPRSAPRQHQPAKPVSTELSYAKAAGTGAPQQQPTNAQTDAIRPEEMTMIIEFLRLLRSRSN